MGAHLASFKVHSRRSGRRRSIRVAVYDDIELLRRDAVKWSRKRVPQGDADFDHAQALCHRWENLVGDKSQNECAYIRLWASKLTMRIITHEVTHAALWISEIDSMELWSQNIEAEETFCHLVSDIASDIVFQLNELGLI